MKPSVFIGSAAESLEVAWGIQDGLERSANVTVWDQGIFGLSSTAIESLLTELEVSDFGIFVLAPEDVTMSRGEARPTARDNVIFELGLWIGRLGRSRSILVVPRGIEVDLPSDIRDLVSATFDPYRTDSNLTAALGPACNRIRKIVKEQGPRAKRGDGYIGAAFPPDLDRELRAADEIWLCGTHHGQILVRFHDLIRTRALDGCRIRSLMVSPEGHAAAMAATRFQGPTDVEHERLKIRSSVAKYTSIQQDVAENFELRAIDFVIPYGGYFLNPNEDHGRAYLQWYTFRVRGGPDKPKYLHEAGSEQFETIRADFENLWEAAGPILNQGDLRSTD